MVLYRREIEEVVKPWDNGRFQFGVCKGMRKVRQVMG